jgi:serine/threonine-protein kinase
VAIAYQHVSEVATPPSALVPGLPKIWDSVLAKAMAKDRQNRYATAAEFKRDILGIMNGGTVAAAAFNPLTDLGNLRARKQEEIKQTEVMPASATEATQAFNPIAPATAEAAEDAGELSRSAQRDAARKKKKKRTILLVVLGVVVLAALVAAGFYFFGGKDTEMVTVPTITSEMSETRAKEKIEAAGFKYEQETDSDSSEPKGTFTKQDPAGGKKAARGSTVKVWFSSGPANAAIPDVSGLTQSEAKSQLEGAGFEVGSTSSEDSATVAKDLVTRTDPASGNSQPKGTSVILYISTGQTSVPDVAGKPTDEAKNILTKDGFSITVQSQSSSSVAKDHAIGTDPAKGSTVEQKSMITLYISTGKDQVSVAGGLVGHSLDNAKAYFTGLGSLTVQVSPASLSDSSTAVVTSVKSGNTDLASGGKVDKGATITLTVKEPPSDDTNTGDGTGDGDGNGSSQGSADKSSSSSKGSSN